MSEDFEYLDFNPLDDAVLKDATVTAEEWVQLCDVDITYEARSIFRTVADRFSEDWSISFRIEIGPETNAYADPGGEPYQADGWALVWAASDDYLGGDGSSVGYFTGTDVADTFGLAFRTWYNRDLIWSVAGAFTDTRTTKDWIGDKHYWVDYDADAQTLSVYVSATATKPENPDEVFEDVDFGDDELYLGITAATGAATSNTYLKEWALEGAEGAGWGLVL